MLVLKLVMLLMRKALTYHMLKLLILKVLNMVKINTYSSNLTKPMKTFTQIVSSALVSNTKFKKSMLRVTHMELLIKIPTK